MIQDIDPHRYYNEYAPVQVKKTDRVLSYQIGKIYLKQEGNEIMFLTWEEICASGLAAEEELIYLFRIDDQRFFLTGELPENAFSGYQYVSVRTLREVMPGYLAFAGITGYQLAQWYRNRRFCGHCGGEMKHSDKERMMYCPKCGLMEYPKISPAVIVGIRDGERLLLSKYEGRSYKRYALIAGFAEIGETIEETVHREVMEEVGLRVKNLSFYKSQPWSFSDTLLLGFFCDLDGDDAITLDREELALAEWVDRADIPVEGDDTSLTKEMMMQFRDGLA